MIMQTMVVFLAGLLLAVDAIAYEQATHALITKNALLQSELIGPSGEEFSPLAYSLGLDSYLPLGSSEYYFEFISTLDGSNAYRRKVQSYEKYILDALKIKWAQTPIQSWVMFGAIREDDNPSEDPPTPRDVETGISRPLHHFFDPYSNKPLNAPGLDAIENDVRKNVDWAIGVRDSFNDPNAPESPRRNRFTVFDARESMFRALTLMTGGGASYGDISGGIDATTKQQWRQAYWATAFRALGDVLHLNQDMAQPQHTRNEPHSGKLCPFEKICLAGHTSIYEKYINARALKDSGFKSLSPFGVFVSIPILPLNFVPYPIPTFAKYTDYWSTSPGPNSLTGKGLADYSNRGFFTAAKNLDSLAYPSPSSNPATYTIRSAVPTLWDGSASTDNTPAYVYFGDVPDTYQQQSASNVALTTYGMWDQFLSSKSLPNKYSLNRLNYDAMADLLLPRAVAYSAGLINFFFRGRLDITLPDEGVFALADHATDDGFTLLRAKIKNTTPAFIDPQGQSQPQNMNGGAFFAVIRYHKDKKYVASLDTVVGAAPCNDYSIVVNSAKLDASTDCRDGVEQIIVSQPVFGESLDAGGQKPVEFDFANSPIPFGMTDVVLQIVYRGPLGSESDAVAVGTLDVSEPTYFTYQNASDYIHLGEHVYTRGEVNSDPALLALVQPQYCVDYRQPPPHLIDGCLEQFALDLTVSFGDLSKPIAQVIGLPNRRLIRFVYLALADEGFNPPIAKKGTRRVRVTARRHASTSAKALLYQEGTCLPLDPFDIPPRISQMTVISSTQIGYHLDQLGKLRGVNGWYDVSCVVNGDNATPGAIDDRNQVMTPLAPMSDEVKPYALTIMPEYL